MTGATGPDIVHAGPSSPVQHEPRPGATSITATGNCQQSTWPSLMRSDPEIVHEILFAFWGARFAYPPFPYLMLAL